MNELANVHIGDIAFFYTTEKFGFANNRPDLWSI
jgi:hypothetical protein